MKFPTMLRKMWTGAEVQAWLDQNVPPVDCRTCANLGLNAYENPQCMLAFGTCVNGDQHAMLEPQILWEKET